MTMKDKIVNFLLFFHFPTVKSHQSEFCLSQQSIFFIRTFRKLNYVSVFKKLNHLSTVLDLIDMLTFVIITI